MTRAFALVAEVLTGLHQSGAEQLLPEPIDRHAGRERVTRVGEPQRKAEPVAWQVRPHRWQHGWRHPLDLGPARVVLATLKHERVAWFGTLGHHQRRGDVLLGLGNGAGYLSDLFLQRIEDRSRVLVHAAQVVIAQRADLLGVFDVNGESLRDGE